MLLRIVILFLVYCALAFSTVKAQSLPPLNIPPQEAGNAFLMQEATNNSDNYFHLQKKIIRWNDKTRYITIHIEDGQYLPNWNPENINAVKAAFWEWEQAMAPRFRFLFMPDARGSDISVGWDNHLKLDDSQEPAGYNQHQTWGKFICKNDIKLALINPAGTIYPPNKIYSTALHEVGHALGLAGHSDNPGDVMFPSGQRVGWDEVNRLTARDINTLKMVYAAKADYTNPEGYHLSNFDDFKKTQKGRRLTLLWISMPGVPFPVPVPIPF